MGPCGAGARKAKRAMELAGAGRDMRILVVGGGGREHALVWALAASPLADKIYCAPGNAGIAETAECVPIGAEGLTVSAALAAWAPITRTPMESVSAAAKPPTSRPRPDVGTRCFAKIPDCVTKAPPHGCTCAGLSDARTVPGLNTVTGEVAEALFLANRQAPDVVLVDGTARYHR